MSTVHIDVDAMEQAVAQLDRAADALGRADGEFADALASVQLDHFPDHRLRSAAEWIAGLRPDLLRRVDAAREANAPLRSGVFTADAESAPSWAVVTPGSTLTARDGRLAGAQVVRAMDGKEPPAAFREATARVRVVADKARRGQRLTAGEVDFLRAFYAALGGRVLELPKYVSGTSFRYPDQGKAPAFSSAEQTTMLGTFGDGLLALSDDKNPGGGWNALPTATRTALDTALADRPRIVPPVGPDGQPRPGAPSGLELTGGDSFRALSTLLAHSAARGGTAFSRSLQVSAVGYASASDQVRARLAELGSRVVVPSADYFRQGDTDGFDTAGADRFLGKPSILLAVGARNHEASLQNLTGADRRPFIRGLVDHDWDDGGAGAGAVVSWLGKASVVGDPAAGVTPRQAQLGYFRLVEEVTERGDAKGRDNFYATATRSMQENPGLSRGLAVATKGNIGLFSQPTDVDSSWDAETGAQLNFRDARRTLMLSQYTAAGRTEIDLAREAYKQDLIRAARTGQPLPGESESMSLQRAGERAGTLDGLSIAGAELAIREKNRDDADRLNAELFDAYEQRTRTATAVKNIASGVAGTVPGVGSLLSAVAATVGEDMILRGRPQQFSPDLRPASLDDGSLQSPDVAAEIAAYDVAAYADSAGEAVDPAARRAGEDNRLMERVVDRSEASDGARPEVVQWSENSPYQQYATAYASRANGTYVTFTTDDAEKQILGREGQEPQ